MTKYHSMQTSAVTQDNLAEVVVSGESVLAVTRSKKTKPKKLTPGNIELKSAISGDETLTKNKEIYKTMQSNHRKSDEECQYSFSLSSVRAMRGSVGKVRTHYPVFEERLMCGGGYELREPVPASDNRNAPVDQKKQFKLLLDRATALCNDLDELIALHYCFYEAVENVFGCDRVSANKKTKDYNTKMGLSLFPSWLRERDFTVSDSMHSLQQSLRQIVRENDNNNTGADT